jgi:Endonuclease/Exonuclease/phosphatase family
MPSRTQPAVAQHRSTGDAPAGADCRPVPRRHDGRSVARAAAVIRAEDPDLVTLNEVCESDVTALERALADRGCGGATVSAFRAVVDRRTGEAFRCRNGQPYGIGLVARLRPAAGEPAVVGGIYPMQDADQPEERAWVCLTAGVALTACTTHLASSDATVARAQCSYLVETAIPAAHGGGDSAPAVLAGDLNLRPGGSPDLRSCIPDGRARVDDDGVQNVVATSEFAITSRRFVDMNGTTDHPGLVVDLRETALSARSP